MRTAVRASAVALAAVLVTTACGDGGGVAVGTDGASETAAPSPAETPSAATESPSTEPSEDPEPETLLIEIRDGTVVGGVPKIEASTGDTVTFRVLADVADEVHVHGFDEHVDVEPGVEATVTFVAQFPGQFEVELEGAKLLIAELVIR